MAKTASLLATARRKADLTQRQLSAATGIPQASVSRVERGLISPRASTIEAWLAACGLQLDVRPALGVGVGVDRSAIRDRLAMSPAQRARLGVQEALAAKALGHGRLRRRRP